MASASTSSPAVAIIAAMIDACGGLSARTDDAALRRLTQAGVVTSLVASLAGQLAGDFSQPRGGAALGVRDETASGRAPSYQ